MVLKIARGTNPTIRFRIEGMELKKDSDSFVTLRRSLEDREVPVDASIGEIQMVLKSDGSKAIDADGSSFSVEGDTATLALSRASTQKMENGVYFLQFTLKDSQGRMFTHKPDTVQILFNLTDFPDKE